MGVGEVGKAARSAEVRATQEAVQKAVRDRQHQAPRIRLLQEGAPSRQQLEGA